MNDNPFQQQKPIPGVKKIFVVSSGKGGVGKSTIALNLAVALGKESRVGLLDADIYGPSLPRLAAAPHQRPEVRENRILPIERYGIRTMSMGYLVDENSAVVWRGPMLFKALDQFFRDVEWGELDYLIIDLPPGTGDIQLSVAQKVPVAGAIAVSTPQNIAFSDVKKSLDMWERVKVPLVGLVENMSYLKLQDQRVQLFPKGELNAYLDAKKIPLLAELPFDPKLAVGCETGVPLLESDPEAIVSQIFFKLAEQIRNYGS